MVLLRRVIGDALRARRQAQHRTLREVSTAANVSLGYLSEIERGQKEASSELLASICEALGAQLSDLLRDVTDTLALAEQVDGVLAPVPHVPAARPATTPEASTRRELPTARDHAARERVPARDHAAAAREAAAGETRITDGQVSVTVRRESPLKTTLMATRKLGERTGSVRPTVYVS